MGRARGRESAPEQSEPPPDLRHSRVFFIDHARVEQRHGFAEVEGREFEGTPERSRVGGFPKVLIRFLVGLSYLLTPLRAGGDEKKETREAFLSGYEKI